MATVEDHEARIAALEASQADYRAVLAAVNALGADEREHSLRLSSIVTQLSAVESRLGSVESKVDDTATRVRSLKDSTAEIRELLVQALDRRPD